MQALQPTPGPSVIRGRTEGRGSWHPARDLPLLLSGGLLVLAVLIDPAALGPASPLACLLAALPLLTVAARRSAAQVRAQHESARLSVELDESTHRRTASEERYRTMIEHAGDPILTFDLETTVTSANHAAERLFGCDRQALVGAAAHRFFAPESMRAIERWAHSHLLTPREPARLELTAVHREGRVLHLEAQAAVLRDGGVPVGTELVCRDITTRKELERLRADFLAMMGHDIRNPLGAIFGYTEMLLDAAHPLSPEQRELLERINNNTRSVLTLIGNFLETSKIEAGQMTIRRASLDVNTLVRRTIEQYAAHAQLVDVTVSVAPTLDLPLIAADALQIERVLANLLTNAIKFTPRGGRVIVSTERLPSSVAVAVADTGVGIAPYEFSRIFQRYTRSGDMSREGTGLGLYIVGTVVEAHGGFMTVDSAPGAGTKFTAYLPITDWRVPALDQDVTARPATATVH